MSESIKVSRSDPTVRSIISAAFPDYRGRKVLIVPCTRPLDVRSYWSGGTRSYFVFVNLATISRENPSTLEVPQQSAFDRRVPGAEAVELRPGFVCVEHVIFCGHDLGLRIHAHPDNLVKLLGEGSL